MPTLIIVALRPSEPTTGAAFTAALSGLTVTAYDLTFDDAAGGVRLGSAAGVFTSTSGGDDTVDITGTGIIQHFTDVAAPPQRVPAAAATAVIVANPPGGHDEYPSASSFDLRLVLRRGGLPIADRRIDVNATVVTAGSPLPGDQNDYLVMAPSAYATIPPDGIGAGAHLDLPADGTPPNFTALVRAVDAVLALDPADGQTLAQRDQLTIAQARRVAAELVWDRVVAPPPQQPRPLAQLYTCPPDDPSVDADDAENDRQRFEAELDAYYAMNESKALRLAGFVFAASAAMACERLCAGETVPGVLGTADGALQALLTFPLITGASGQSTLTHTAVLLTGSPAGGALNPAFVVPAAHFYALDAQLPAQVDAAQRFSMASASAEAKVLVALQAAVQAGVIAATEPPVAAAVPATPVGAAQSARRLRAIGQAQTGAPQVPLVAPVTTLVGGWLAHDGQTGPIDADFWAPTVAANPGAAAYLNLLLHVVTDNFDPLITAVQAAPLSVGSVAELVAVADQRWRELFLPPGAAPRLDLLPPFTLVGPASTPADQVEVFIARLRLFFAVPYAPAVPVPAVPAPGAPPLFPPAGGDVLARFVLHYAGVYTVGGAHDAAAVAAAVQATFPGDAAAQRWLAQALATLDALHALTAFAPPELRFSLMEALYARGFTSAQGVRSLAAPEFRHALQGCVGYPFAAQIQAAAGGCTASPEGQTGPFAPVNGGDLTDCVPLEHLSPFGAVAYLHDLLAVSPSSTCEQPLHPGAADALGAQLAARRGPLGGLHATAANLATPLPAIDLVNESLEALAASVAGGGSGAGGAVFDTSPDGVARHPVAGPPMADPVVGSTAAGSTAAGHDGGELFAAIPEHSAPAAVGVSPAGAAAYAALAADASAPPLPYDQPVDTARAYLEALGGSRHEVMRRFRRDITEFVLDPAPAPEPAGFASHVWRYPVRLELALEYLCLLPQEYELLFGPRGAEDERLDPWQVYGFPSRYDDDVDWTTVVSRVDELLRRLGLSYCELRELQLTGLVPFRVLTRTGGRDGGHNDGDHNDSGREDNGDDGQGRLLPECQPGCLDDLRVIFVDGDTAERRPEEALWRLAVVVRLFRRLRDRCAGGLAFPMLADIATVLHLFDEDGQADPDFPRQLAALLMLAEDFAIELGAGRHRELPDDPGPTDRMPILGLWATGEPFAHAVELLIGAVGDTAQRHEPELRVTPELAKVVADNLGALSALCGFDPDTAADTWYARPTHTLRFAEVLLKIYRSPFTVGEVLFLFTTAEHLAGEDPFPLQDRGEAVQDPLALADTEPRDGDGPHSLWALRGALRSVELDDEDVKRWTWRRIAAAMRTDLGYAPPAGDDPLLTLAQHFFGDQVHATAAQRRFAVDLPAADTSPDMWAGGPPDGPFQYDPDDGTLWAALPMRDADVLDRLLRLRPLNQAERVAVRDLYFAPRAALAPFAALFDNPVQTIEQLIHTASGKARFALVRRLFALVHARCTRIAEHLAAHVQAVTETGGDAPVAQAWQVLRGLWADENFGRTPWEDDSGAPPEVTWTPRPSGGAFAAILGVLGTGLVGEYDRPASCDEAGGAPSPPLWREVRGPLSAFGQARDERNAPVPTVIPALDFTLTPAQQGYVALRNGLALLDATGEPLGGAQPFAVRWSGVLLVERGGSYRFHAATHGPADGPDDDRDCEGRSWRLTLRRGQRRWTVLNKDFAGEPAPDHRSGPQRLHRGAYEITIDVEQREPTFERREEVCRQSTGFRFAYQGPDTGEEVAVLPFDKLFRAAKDSTLKHGVQPPAGEDSASPSGQPGAWLDGLYTGTLRDARRTYQRAFKGLLLAHRFRLCAETVPAYRQSELGHLLAHGDTFAGVAHPRTGPASFGTHRAWLALDLLPVADPYPPAAVLARPVPPYPPVPDQRSSPSRQRCAALFDVWERLYDYVALRRASREARDRPAWLLFAEVGEHQPDDPVVLLRHLGVDLRHAPLVTSYFVQSPGPSPHVLADDDLADERWATRAWRGNTWLDRLCRHVSPLSIAVAAPHAWAADRPDNANLTRFLQDAFLGNGEPRRYRDLRELNDCLRLRAREALLAYLTGMSRVALPWGGVATEPRELSDLLLTDVAAGLCPRSSRIQDAVSAVQAFVQRALLGLEPSFVVTPSFAAVWQRRFASLRDWQACVRREVYRENWVEWDELRLARRSEAFAMLEQRLAEDTLSIAEPGGLSWWSGPRPPSYGCLTPLQDAVPATLLLVGPPPEGLGLLASPEPGAQPSWLAPVTGPTTPPPPDPERTPATRDDVASSRSSRGNATSSRDEDALPAGDRLPLWLAAAISLGAPFIRVAAAGIPPGSAHFAAHGQPGGCCADCGCGHEPLVDEYYFWLGGSRRHVEDDAVQDAEAGVTVSTVRNPADQTSDWHRPEQLPGLLEWPPRDTVHLWWCRERDGQLQQPRRSTDSVLLAAGQAVPTLEFDGRSGDSLRFTVPGAPVPAGHTDPAPPGFRYDLVTDSAVVLPLVAPPAAGQPSFPGGLDAYPYFAFHTPGAPLLPLSPFAVAMTVAGALRTHCDLEAALAWYDLAYRPAHSGNTWAACDDRRPRHPGRDEACRPSSPVDAATARHRAVLLAYLETLLQIADGHLLKGGVEAAQLARVVLDAMARLLGPPPRRVHAQDVDQPDTVAQFDPSPAPLNPRLLALSERLADRQALVRRCLDGHRLRRGDRHDSGAFWADADPRAAWQPDGDCDCGNGCGGCCSGPYRFTFVVQKALELAAEVRALGATLLSLYEKGDAEALAAIRAGNERQVAELTVSTRQLQWREADWQVQALYTTKQGALARLAYYQRMLRNGRNAGEAGYEAATTVSLASRVAANVSEAIAQGIGMTPDMWLGVAGIAGSPLQFNQFPVGNKLAAGFSTAARICNSLAEIANTTAGLSLTDGGWQRRSDEWQHQVEVITIELRQIERQILAAQRRRDAAQRDLNTQRQQSDHAAQVQDLLRDKLTSSALYLHLQRATATQHRTLYDLALDTARRAQRAFTYERGTSTRAFLPEPGWDTLHEGLMAGERLHTALRQLEGAYLEENCREYELGKHVSLRAEFPMAFLQLQQTGCTEIELPEWLFDLDYPGHYLRRLRSVTLTIPCVVGPYTGVHCRLTLFSSQTRLDPRLSLAPQSCCRGCADPCGCSREDEPAAGPCRCPGGGLVRHCPCATGSCTACRRAPVDEPAGYALAADDDRVLRSYAATEAIATSTGQNDSGLFELSFRDERYLPFELRGAVSRWRLELPPENNRISPDSLGDVVMHLNYTAREGGERLRDAARTAAQSRLPGNGVRLFDLRHDFPDEWYRLRAAGDSAQPAAWPLRLGREHFPYLPGGCDVRITRLDVFLEAADPGCLGVLPVRFVTRHTAPHDPAQECRCQGQEIECVASADWPCLFHGTLDVELPPLGRHRDRQLGELRLPHLPGGPTAVYLVTAYRTHRPGQTWVT